jgi:hypothetical protein
MDSRLVSRIVSVEMIFTMTAMGIGEDVEEGKEIWVNEPGVGGTEYAKTAIRK